MGKNHFMVDIETMGTSQGCPIVSIGAVEFISTGELTRDFYCRISLESCMSVGLRPDASTIMWWMQQSEKARQDISTGESCEISSALLSLSSFFGDKNNMVLWGNGAGFDNEILKAAYSACGLQKLVWPHWADRCFRTLAVLRNKSKTAPVGTHHNALDDAIFQVHHLLNVLDHIEGLGLSDFD